MGRVGGVARALALALALTNFASMIAWRLGFALLPTGCGSWPRLCVYVNACMNSNCSWVLDIELSTSPGDPPPS